MNLELISPDLLFTITVHQETSDGQDPGTFERMMPWVWGKGSCDFVCKDLVDEYDEDYVQHAYEWGVDHNESFVSISQDDINSGIVTIVPE